MPRVPLSRDEIQRGVGKCLNTTHYIILGACVILFIFGIAMFGVGVSTQADEKAAQTLHVPGIESLPIWMIVLGIFITALSIVGAIGSVMYNRPLLAVFVVLLGILTIMEFCVGIAAAVEYKRLPNYISKAWGWSSNKTRNYMQTNYDCCGYWNATDRPYLPCPGTTGSGTADYLGCYDPIYKQLGSIASGVAGAGIALSLLQTIGVVITIVLLFRIRNVVKEHVRLDEGSSQSLFPSPFGVQEE